MKHKKEKKDFKLYVDSLQVIKKMTDEEAGQFLRKCLSFWEEEEIEVERLVDLSFESTKAQFERDWNSYSKSCEANASNGKKGGRPKKANESEEKRKKRMGLLESERKQKKGDTDKDTETDKDTDKKYMPLQEVEKLLSSEIRKEITRVLYKHGYKPSIRTAKDLDKWFDKIFNAHGFKTKESLPYLEKKLIAFDTWLENKRKKGNLSTLLTFLTKD